MRARQRVATKHLLRKSMKWGWRARAVKRVRGGRWTGMIEMKSAICSAWCYAAQSSAAGRCMCTQLTTPFSCRERVGVRSIPAEPRFFFTKKSLSARTAASNSFCASHTFAMESAGGTCARCDISGSAITCIGGRGGEAFLPGNGKGREGGGGGGGGGGVGRCSARRIGMRRKKS